MKLGSLFDGSGGFPLAARMCGIAPVWASEIEPYPIRVTKKNFPNMKHLGDITKINGAEIEPVDIITFGSPCQDLSIAGRRAGLEGERSSLFLEAIRIVKEMRESTNGVYPKYIVWENVPGAYSSNNGEDFRTVLEEITQITEGAACTIPKPRGGWSNAGAIVGRAISIAWRTLDSQYWGVPQRRRRIFLVADFGGGSASEILFERNGLQRDFKESRKEGEGVAETVKRSTREQVVYGLVSKSSNSWKSDNPDSGVYIANTARTIDTSGTNPACNQGGMLICSFEERSPAGGEPRIHGDITPTDVIVLNDQGGESIGFEKNKIPTLRAEAHGNHPIICIAGNTIDRQEQNGGNGVGAQEDVSYTLNTIDRHAVCFSQDTYDKYTENEIGTTLKAQGGSYGGGSETLVKETTTIRRLTPLECCRLQGFPDDWCEGVEGSDSAQYKMWGNGVALPCVLYVMEGIYEQRNTRILHKNNIGNDE